MSRDTPDVGKSLLSRFRRERGIYVPKQEPQDKKEFNREVVTRLSTPRRPKPEIKQESVWVCTKVHPDTRKGIRRRKNKAARLAQRRNRAAKR